MSKKNNRKTTARLNAFLVMDAERRKVQAKKKQPLPDRLNKEVEHNRKEMARKPKVAPVIGSKVKQAKMLEDALN